MKLITNVVMMCLFIALSQGATAKFKVQGEQVTEPSISSEEETDLTEEGGLPTEANAPAKLAETIEEKKEVTKKTTGERKKEEKLPAKEIITKVHADLATKAVVADEGGEQKATTTTLAIEGDEISAKNQSKETQAADKPAAKSTTSNATLRTPLISLIVSFLLTLLLCT